MAGSGPMRATSSLDLSPMSRQSPFRAAKAANKIDVSTIAMILSLDRCSQGRGWGELMKRTPSSDAEQRQLGEFQGRIGRNSNPRAQAFNHNLGRNVRAARVLTLIQLLRESGTRLSGTVTCARGQKQNFSSDRTMTILGNRLGRHAGRAFSTRDGGDRRPATLDLHHRRSVPRPNRIPVW